MSIDLYEMKNFKIVIFIVHTYIAIYEYLFSKFAYSLFPIYLLLKFLNDYIKFWFFSKT